MIYFSVMCLGIILFRIYFDESGLYISYSNRSRSRFVIMGIALFLISALRDEYVGNDTRTYIGHFTAVSSMSWKELLSHYGGEPGFYVLAKGIAAVTDDYRVMLAAVAMIYAIAVIVFIKRYSTASEISVIMLFSFQFFAFSLSGLRQTVAVSIVLFSFIAIEKRKLIPFILCIALAFLFHNSAIFALPLYAISREGGIITWWKRGVFVIALPIIYLLRGFIFKFLQLWFYSDYQAYDSFQGSWLTFALYFTIWILYVVAACREENQMSNLIERMMMIGIAIQLFVPMEPNIFRVAMYYQIGSLIAVPQILETELLENRYRWIPYFVCIAVLFYMYFNVTYYAAGANPYQFYWQ